MWEELSWGISSFEGPFQLESEEAKLHDLMQSVSRLWGEATWSYVYGNFRGCIVLLAMMVERLLKTELERRGEKTGTLGHCIKLCRDVGILPASEDDETTRAILFINELRNDVVHARIELNQSRAIKYRSGSDHEEEEITDFSRNFVETEDGLAITGDGEELAISFTGEPSVKRIYQYKRAARDAIDASRKIVEYIDNTHWVKFREERENSEQ